MDQASDESATIQFLRDGEETFPAWIDAIASARSEILLEMYWFASDFVGRRFAELLSSRARDGIDVMVLYDSLGSVGTDKAMFAEMESAGVRVLEYHPIAPWRRRFEWERINFRDHRKILVIDATVAFTGGINLCEKAAPKEQGGAGWRDDAVRVTGPAALELRALFFDNWLNLGGPSPRQGANAVRRKRAQLIAAAREQAGPLTLPPPSLLSRLSRGSMKRTATALATRGKHSTDLARAPSVQVFGHAASGARRTIRNLYVRQIRRASKQILIANSYFIPDIAVQRALERAARRGVEVHVLVPAESDVPSVAFAARAMYAGLMRAGIHIHEWIEGMMHAKTALIDRWATTGSYNLDYRSLRYNLEANVASAEPAFVEAVEQSLRADLARCREVDPVAWSKRPWLEKALEWFHFLIRKLL